MTTPADPNQLVWRLDGVEVARAYGAEADTTYLFLPYWGRNLQATWPSPPATGVYGCADLSFGGVHLAVLTSDNGWSDLGALPAAWGTLNLQSCADTTDGDRVDLEIAVNAGGGRYVGTVSVEVRGGGPRAGEVLTIDGVFDIAY